jgi:hypothetical protein
MRAHVQLCWLALLFIRVAETRAGDTWRNLRHELDRSPPSTCPSRPATSPSHPATMLPPTDNLLTSTRSWSNTA